MDLFTERCKKCYAVKKCRKPCDVCTTRAVTRAALFAPAVKRCGEDLICLVEGKAPDLSTNTAHDVAPGETYGFSVADAMGMAGATRVQIIRGKAMVRNLEKTRNFGALYGGKGKENLRALAKMPSFGDALERDIAHRRVAEIDASRRRNADDTVIRQILVEQDVDAVLGATNKALGLPDPEMQNFRPPVAIEPTHPSTGSFYVRDVLLGEVDRCKSSAELEKLVEHLGSIGHLPLRIPSQTRKVYRAVLRRHIEARAELPLAHVIGAVPVTAMRLGIYPGQCMDCESQIPSSAESCPHCKVKLQVFSIEGLLRFFTEKENRYSIRLMARSHKIAIVEGDRSPEPPLEKFALPRDFFDSLLQAVPMPPWGMLSR